VSEEGWTIRSGEAGVLISRDSGETAHIEGDDLNELQRLTRDLPDGIDHPTTAAAAASISEARHIEPRLGSTRPEATAAVDRTGVEIVLGTLVRPLDRPFEEVLASRQSDRRFQHLELGDLATLLYHGSRIRGWHESDDGYQMTSRPSPSAGGRHPYELMVAIDDVAGVTDGLWLFDAARCSLIRREVDAARLQAALSAVNRAAGLTSNAPATLFVVAYFQRTLARYPCGSTLVWRDMGAVATTLHLVATASDLSSCVVGTSGVLEYDESRLVTDGIALVVGRPVLGAPARGRVTEVGGPSGQ
jgi:SagB-type dehydrogenase family enzyme